jgi:hypothetical protein
LDTSSTGAHAFTVTATSSDGLSTEVTDHYTVARPPVVTIDAPADGATFGPAGQEVTAAYTCTDGDGGPGIASCDGTVADGAALDTSTPGSHTFRVTATSRDGLSTTVTRTYTVARIPTRLAARALLFGGPAATLTRADTGAPIGGETIAFTAGGRTFCTAQTGDDGVARCPWRLVLGYTATFAGTQVYDASTAHAGLI